VNDADEIAREPALGSYADRLHRVIDAGVALNAELSLDDLLGRIIRSAADLTGARYVALGVIDPRGQDLERFVTHGVDEETRRTIGELPRGRGILGALIREARPLRLHDLHDDPRSVGFPPGHPPMGTFLGVPIFLRGVAYGNLYLAEKDGGMDFTPEDQELIELLAGQAAVAIENARLFESSQRWARHLESLSQVTQALTAILLGLEPLARSDEQAADDLRELVKGALVNVRRVMVDLRPPALDDFGLVPALERFGADLAERTELSVEVVAGPPARRLAPDVETTLYRITQEAVANAITHGRAGAIRIVLEQAPGAVTLTISDDGRGFDPSQVSSDRFGLRGMRERAALVGGELDIRSAAGQGARVTAWAPVAEP